MWIVSSRYLVKVGSQGKLLQYWLGFSDLEKKGNGKGEIKIERRYNWLIKILKELEDRFKSWGKEGVGNRGKEIIV